MAARGDSVAAMRNIRCASVNRNKGTQDDMNFCNEQNIEDAVSTLSEELESLGISDLTDNASNLLSIRESQNIFVNLLNASWNLVHKHRKLMRIHESLKDSQHRITNDNTNLASHVKRLKESLKKQDHSLGEYRERERRLKIETDLLSRNLKREKEETLKLRKQMQSKEVQHVHEIRRIQESGNKLREKLQKSAVTYTSKDKGFQKLQAEYEKKIRIYEETIERLEDNNGLMLDEINELKDTIALHADAIDLHIEASGVWNDTEL